jgi:hypothetical protein
MLETELATTEQETTKPQHPYQNSQEHTICDLKDKECLQRLVQAFSDCD